MVMDVQGKLRQVLGSLKDHASIGKAMIYNRDGGFSGIEIAVVRATGHQDCPIDDKYMHEILFLVSNSPGSSVPFLAETISHRLDKTRDCVVALKTLLLVHRLLRGGDRHFEQDLRSVHLSGHLQINAKWFLRNPDPTTCFLHNYAAFLKERIGWVINQAGKLEPIMSKGLEFRFYEEKSIDIVFRKLPKCQQFLDQVLQCSPSNILASDLLLQAAMSNILKESFQVYMTFCEGVATLSDLLFDFSNAARVSALHILERSSHLSYKLFEFYENCKRSVGNKNLDYPTVEIISTDHVTTVEQFLGCTSTTQKSSSYTKLGSSPLTLGGVARPIEMEDAVIGKEDGKKTLPNPSTLFSCTLETRVSMVWVVFNEDEPQESRISFDDGTLGEASDLSAHEGR